MIGNLRSGLALALACTPLLAQAPEAPLGGESQGSPPNVVFILADDLGWGELGSFGQTKIPTPHLDRLAEQGMRLTAHYSGNPVCAPSRCVLLTGQHGGRAIVRNNWENGGWGEFQPEGQYPLPPGTPSVARALQAEGFGTCAVGKWGLGGPVTSGSPNLQGFDHFYGYLCQRKAHNYYPTHLWRNDRRDPLPGNGWFKAHQKIAEPLESTGEYWERFAGGTYAPDAMLDEALGWLDENGTKPFFLYYPSPIPHAALQVPPADLEALPLEWDETAYLGERSYLPHPRPRAAYAAMVAHLDREVGALLAKLDELGAADNTIVVFSSDNGPTYNGGTDSDFFASAGPFRGLKGSVYEGGIRVPTIVRWPGRVAPGSSSDYVSGFQDWFPTLAEACGAQTPAGLDGVSLIPTLTGGEGQEPHGPLVWELGPKAAIRLGRWKLIYSKLRSKQPKAELYDLEADPAESNDLADSEPEVLARMRSALIAERTPSAVFPQPWLDAQR